MGFVEAILVLMLGAAFFWGYQRFMAEKAAKQNAATEQTVEDVIEEIKNAEVTE